MQTPISAIVHIAPPGWSYHGNNLERDELGVPCFPCATAREQALIEALERIVLETMHYSPAQRIDGDSYLPEAFVEIAQRALATFGMRVQPDPAQVAA